MASKKNYAALASAVERLQVLQESREYVEQLEAQLGQIETELATAMDQRQPGFSAQMVTLLEATKGTLGQLDEARETHANRESTVEVYAKHMDRWIAEKRTQDFIGQILNRALKVTVALTILERNLERAAEDTAQSVSSQISTLHRSDQPLSEELNALRADLTETLESELVAPTQRSEWFGAPHLGSILIEALLRLRPVEAVGEADEDG